jgi:secondary thiamine-phosphate synthase enzyme
MIRFELATTRRTEAIDITSYFGSRTWPDGILVASVEHTTAAIFLGESGAEMFEDYERVASRLIEQYGPFRHEVWNPGNAQSHILSSFIGTQLLLPISHGQLDLGTWQRVIFLELDGPRHRSIALTSVPGQEIG